MHTCSVKWRPSGGRGEWEAVPSQLLVGKHVTVQVPHLNLMVPSETQGTDSQGKPRLRKDDPNNRSKLHLVPLVMAIARLPDPAREDHGGQPWPLENKGFVISQMDFEVVSVGGGTVVLRPLRASVLHSDQVIDLDLRFQHIAQDMKAAADPAFPFAAELKRHFAIAQKQVNDVELRRAADDVLAKQTLEFGSTNAAAITTIKAWEKLPESDLEHDVKGKEGRILTRVHSYRERDRKLVKKAKARFKTAHGRLYCECCGFEPAKFYGARGEDRIQAHHKVPVEEMLPDTETRADDLAMVCPNCHDIIHAKRPWLAVAALKDALLKSGNHHF